MAHWAVVLPADRYDAERLFARETVELPAPGPRPDDLVLLVGGEPAVIFGLGRVRSRAATGEPVVAYTHRLLDEPLAAGGLAFDGPGVFGLDEGTFEAYAGKVGAELRVDGPKREWLVSVDLPIEAYSAAEAVRAFWSYVYELGPHELPAFVSPADDELAMQAFVLGAEANLDPEEDDEE